MKYICPNCKNEIEENSTFCDFCGEPVKNRTREEMLSGISNRESERRIEADLQIKKEFENRVNSHVQKALEETVDNVIKGNSISDSYDAYRFLKSNTDAEERLLRNVKADILRRLEEMSLSNDKSTLEKALQFRLRLATEYPEDFGDLQAFEQKAKSSLKQLEEQKLADQREKRRKSNSLRKSAIVLCLAVFLAFIVVFVLRNQRDKKREESVEQSELSEQSDSIATKSETGSTEDTGEEAVNGNGESHETDSQSQPIPVESAAADVAEKPYLEEWDIVQGNTPENGIHYVDRSDRLGISKPEWDVYFHIMYADDNAGSGISQESLRPFLGAYVSTVEQDNTDPQWYTWLEIMTMDPKEGIKATWYDNKNIEYYLHFAYADDSTANGFSIDEKEGKRYLGYYIDDKRADSSDPVMYSWIERIEFD